MNQIETGAGPEEHDEEAFVVMGQCCGMNGTIAFFRFLHPDGVSGVAECVFRANRVFIDGVKVVSSSVRSGKFEAFYEAYLREATLKAVVMPITLNDPVYKIVNAEVRPKFYSRCVWLGDVEPPEYERQSRGQCNSGSVEPMEQEDMSEKIERQLGMLVYRNLSGLGFIRFELEGREQVAQFTAKRLFVDGEIISPETYNNWSRGKREQVHFNATRVQNLTQHVQMEKRDGKETVELRFQPEWRCTAVWIGVEPSAEQITTKKQKAPQAIATEFKDLVKDCEYGCGRLTKFIDRSSGIVTAKKDRPVLFRIQDLIVDGRILTQEDRLSAVLQLGDILSCFTKPVVPPRIIGDIVCHHVAVQIWRGKRSVTADNSSAGMAIGGREVSAPSIRSTFPLPNEATHYDQTGTVIEIDGVLGKLRLESPDPLLSGQRVLFSRNRTYVRGAKLNFKDFIHDFVSIGDALAFDMILADQAEAKSEYEWLALLSWVGEKPSAEAASLEVTKRPDSYRAKVLCFDQPLPGQGVASGILNISAGPNNINERVFFHRAQLYIFGAKMVNVDLAYILSENDKVQLEMEHCNEEETETFRQRYKCEIKFKATLVWIGPLPKTDLNCVAFPSYVGNVIYPFLTKRGMDEEYFTRLVLGEIPPKASSSISSQSQNLIAPIAEIPPNTVSGRAIELRPAEVVSAGCEHGIFLVENGPAAGEKAFFNRNVLWCFGHHMVLSDLMYVIREADKFFVEVQGGTNNKSVPFKIVSAWIGPHPSEKLKEQSADEKNPAFRAWLDSHGIRDYQEFLEVVRGQAPNRPFFPLALEAQNARIVHIFPHNKTKLGNGCEYGILKIYQGSLAKKDVLFERSSVYLWNVNFAGGDLSYVLHESDRVFCEVSEILGKERKKWQVRLNTQSIPKYCASLVYIGGGRPKGNMPGLTSLEALAENANLQQWLGKRGISLEFFAKVINCQLPPKQVAPTTVTLAPPPVPLSAPFEPTSRFGWSNQQEQQPLMRHIHNQHARVLPEGPSMLLPPQRTAALPPPPPRLSTHSSPPQRPSTQAQAVSRMPPQPPTVSPTKSEFENPIVRQAKAMLSRVMACTSPDDPKVKQVINHESDVQLALFVAKTLESAVESFRSSSSEIPQQNLGPIAPPGKKVLQQQGVDPGYGTSRAELSGYSNRTGLYGLEEPLLSYPVNQRQRQKEVGSSWEDTINIGGGGGSSSNNSWLRKPPVRRESPSDFIFNEPPFKRKSNPPFEYQ